MIVYILEMIEILDSHVITELSEGKVLLSFVMLQQILELYTRVFNTGSPSLKVRMSINELRLGYSPLSVNVNVLEINPKLVKDSQVHEQESELCL
jgi:hypothetical protein